MKVTILGCGSSGGVPVAGGFPDSSTPNGDWGACDPSNPRNRRRRASILVEEGPTSLLVDTTPDLREQLLSRSVRRLNAVFYTHAHADHCHGIDDLRGINFCMEKAIPAYSSEETMNELKQRFAYAFRGPSENGKFYRPSLIAHTLDGDASTPAEVGSVTVVPFTQNHGNMPSLGLRFGDFAYSTDVWRLNAHAFDVLKGVKVWMVDCMRERPHPTHSHLEQTLEWIARVSPERAWLTHMDQSMDYASLLKKLPPNVEPAYDGLEISL